MTDMRAGFVSLGHAGGQFNADIRNKGALWIAEHRRVSDGAEGPVLAIQGRGSDWCYFVAEPSGAVLRAGALPDCVGCHASAGEKPIFTKAP